MPPLRLEALRHSYAGRPVLRGIDLTVRRGEIVVLVGGSGSGKTTLLRIVAGLERAQSGSVRLRGTDVDGSQARRFVPPERRGLGMVFQEHALWPHLTARENVAIALPAGAGRRDRDAAALLDAVGLGEFCYQRPGRLSGGQQQRVALARALATGSDLMLLDEPLSSLDEMVRDRLRPLIREALHRRGRAALFVSHDRLDAWRMADRIAVLEDGVLSQADTPQALYAAPATESVARYMGAEGKLSVWATGLGQVVTIDGTRLAATCVGLPAGFHGIALAHPEGVRITSGEGLRASRMDCVFEAGRWRVRWCIGGSGDELVGLHDKPPPEHVRLSADPDRFFAFQGRE